MGEDDARLHLVIDTTSGDLEDDFEATREVAALIREVLDRVDIEPSTPGLYELVHDGRKLPDHERLADLGIEDGDTLFLVW